MTTFGVSAKSSLHDTLVALQAQHVNLTASRIIDQMLMLSRNPFSRKVITDIDGIQTEVDASGNVFDSLWNEFVGSNLCTSFPIPMVNASNMLQYLYDYASGRTTEAYTDAIDILNTVRGQHAKTFYQLGYRLDQPSLDDKHRVNDVYTFLKMLAVMDFPTCYSVVQHKSTEQWHTAFMECIRGIAMLVCEIAKLVDGLSPVLATFTMSSTGDSSGSGEEVPPPSAA